MTHYNIEYKPGKEADIAALRDARKFMGPTAMAYLEGAAAGGASIQSLDFAMRFVGVSGYPFHAFCRRHALAKYREWMHEGGVMTDEDGFPLEGEGE